MGAVIRGKANGINAIYCRIRQVDFSGKSAVSKTAIAYIETLSDNGTITMFPNPATTAVTLSGKNPIGHIVITDITGKTAAEFNTAQQELNINISGYESGMYLIKSSNGISQKLIVE